ncbi:uncharacterized protein FIBRA_07901 [Fibroporia radiculosa]|uniref:Peptidase S1 domain-containing protein n=1 Tax=Fibroporia radiculosa TaxID=599839 RepID=J4IC25_9APHY|nr:uncharacterized protein FIBRA_07901 [Fibroporia radiculosa]CCM05671.1 predicted protein [Fibroporia radiculosa]
MPLCPPSLFAIKFFTKRIPVQAMTSTDIPPELLVRASPIAPPITSSPPPYSVSESEAKFYYAGLPSNPLLVYRTGHTPWEKPTGPEAYLVLKEVKPVFSHEIVTVWDDLGPKVCSCLDYVQVTWTSVDVVRFAEVGKTPGSPVLWIGVMPQSLSSEDAHIAAVDCQKLLQSYKLTDVEVEFRESIFARSACLQLLRSVPTSNPTAVVRDPLTPTLGLRIAARATPYTEGTGALYISEGSNSNKVYVLSARHVVFPPDLGNNELYNCTDVCGPRRQILLPGPKAFQTLLKSTAAEIWRHNAVVGYNKRRLDDFKDDDFQDDDGMRERAKIERYLKDDAVTIKALYQFHDETTRYWSKESQRVIGHVAYSPPIAAGTGAERYTEDWAFIELDHDKIDWNTFKGNVIDLGEETLISDITLRMSPGPVGLMSFKYPGDRLLRLRGVIEEDELRCPQMLDAHGERSLVVMKNSCATGLTIGCATGIKSFVREYFPDRSPEMSIEWAILPYDQKSGAFSAPGDSGAIIVDGEGRIGGLLTGGTGQTESIDVTYASPFYWLLQRIRTHFPNAVLYQPTA